MAGILSTSIYVRGNQPAGMLFTAYNWTAREDSHRFFSSQVLVVYLSLTLSFTVAVWSEQEPCPLQPDVARRCETERGNELASQRESTAGEDRLHHPPLHPELAGPAIDPACRALDSRSHHPETLARSRGSCAYPTDQSAPSHPQVSFPRYQRNRKASSMSLARP